MPSSLPRHSPVLGRMRAGKWLPLAAALNVLPLSIMGTRRVFLPKAVDCLVERVAKRLRVIGSEEDLADHPLILIQGDVSFQVGPVKLDLAWPVLGVGPQVYRGL